MRIIRHLKSLNGRILTDALAIHALLIPLLFSGVFYIAKQACQDRFINRVQFQVELSESLRKLGPEPLGLIPVLEANKAGRTRRLRWPNRARGSG